jgi:hypothetical protein
MTPAGQTTQPSVVLVEAFAAVRLAERQFVFQVLRQGGTKLAAIGYGQTLWRIYQAVPEVESW